MHRSTVPVPLCIFASLCRSHRTLRIRKRTTMQYVCELGCALLLLWHEQSLANLTPFHVHPCLVALPPSSLSSRAMPGCFLFCRFARQGVLPVDRKSHIAIDTGMVSVPYHLPFQEHREHDTCLSHHLQACRVHATGVSTSCKM